MAGNFEEQYLLFLAPYTNQILRYDRTPSGSLVPVLAPAIANANAWETAVRKDILKMSTSRVGAVLLRSIKFHGQVINIGPGVQDCNSGVVPGDSILDNADLKIGVSADVRYSPDTYSAGGKCSARDLSMGGYAPSSDEVLLHELVHALRTVSRKLNLVGLKKGLSFYENSEEFNAVLIQGIYASERKTPVRASHYHHFEIDKELSSSMRFFQSGEETFKYVEKFCKENPGFTRALAEINVPFNPINSYYYDREQVRNLGRSGMAQGRDKMMPLARSVIEFLKKEFAKP